MQSGGRFPPEARRAPCAAQRGLLTAPPCPDSLCSPRARAVLSGERWSPRSRGAVGPADRQPRFPADPCRSPRGGGVLSISVGARCPSPTASRRGGPCWAAGVLPAGVCRPASVSRPHTRPSVCPVQASIPTAPPGSFQRPARGPLARLTKTLAKATALAKPRRGPLRRMGFRSTGMWSHVHVPEPSSVSGGPSTLRPECHGGRLRAAPRTSAAQDPRTPSRSLWAQRPEAVVALFGDSVPAQACRRSGLGPGWTRQGGSWSGTRRREPVPDGQ